MLTNTHKLDKIINLVYTKDFSNFSFEELYRIVYNFVLYKNYIPYELEISSSTESNISNIQYKKKNLISIYYLELLYNILDSRNCVFNNIQELCDVSMYPINLEKINYKDYLEELYNKKKYKQNIIILSLQTNNINEDIMKKILFTQLK